MPPKTLTPALSGQLLQQIFSIVLSKTGFDLRHYKPATIRRRILRRIGLLGIKNPDHYLERLRKDKEEAATLAVECMVQVTNFFRDPGIYAVLSRKVFPRLLERRDASEPVRIWVAGCATGEEAYSMAISLLECANTTHVPVQIFGTDVDADALAIARHGLYPHKIEKDVPKALLAKYFTRTSAGYEISKSVRSLCTFAQQNITTDPPFSRLDLVSCRNVLIYINDETQSRVFSLFHYALRNDGYLLLGRSEAIGSSFSELFGIVDRRANLYRRKSTTARLPAPFQKIGVHPLEISKDGHALPLAAPTNSDFDREIDLAVLNALNPCVVVVNEEMNIVEVRGDVSRYLRFPSGKTSLNLAKVAREELAPALRMAVEQSRRRTQTVRKTVPIRRGRRLASVDVDIRPLVRPLSKERVSVVLFRESTPPASAPVRRERRGDHSDRARLKFLKEELASTRAYLRSIVSENERASQELRSANEEILSSNEELQSTNEELQTAKEELESTNEEITTVNEELETRNAELKRSFEALSRSRDELREAQAIARLGNWVWNLRENTVQWSDELYRIYGVKPPPDYITSYDRFLTLVHPEDVAETRKTIESAARKGTEFSFVHRIVRPDGAVRVLQVRGQPVRDPSGKIIRLRGTGQDITEAVETEAQLRQSEQRFRLLVEEASEYAIFLLDLNGNINSWNAGAQRLKGYTSDEILGKNFSVFYGDEDRKKGIPQQALRRAREEGRWKTEGWRYRKDGTRFWASVVIEALRDPEGSIIGFSKITRDMTESKMAEEALKESRAGLERRVEERTRELKANEERLLQKTRDLQKAERNLKRYSRELQQTNENLVRSNQELEQFAYVASHDLQEPLRKVSNNSDLLVRRLGRDLPPEAQRCLDQIIGSVERMHVLIDDLLRFSRATRDTSGDETVDVGLEIRRALDNLPEASIADIVIGDMPTVAGSALHLRQIFQNLIGNAIKFRGKDKPRIEVTAAPAESGWTFSVSDNGIGIPPEYRERIFVIFQRLHNRQDYPGTGIGLAICRKIVESRGGKIWVTASPTGGSVFSFSWPRADHVVE